MTVLILGATSDIGMAIARAFAARKSRLQLAARKPALLAHFQSDLAIRFGAESSLHAFDAQAPEQFAAFWEGLGLKPDVVVWVAGYMAENETALHDDAALQATLAVNYTAPVAFLNRVAMHFREQGRGTIVGISSVAGERGRQSNFLYGSAKAGFTAYLSGLRNYLFHSGAHVVTVLPGFVDTRMTAGMKLPPLLTAQPAEVGEAVWEAVRQKRDVVYVRWIWRYIMLVIRSIPEFLFKKRKL